MGTERPHETMATTSRSLSRQTVLLLIAFAGVAGLLWRGYESHQPLNIQERQERHHADTLANWEFDPYQYKFFAMAWAVEGVHRATGLSIRSLYRVNLALSLFALLIAHYAWLRAWLGRSAAVGATFLLAAYAHLLFLQHYHYPNEFWGVAGLCILLRLEWLRASLLAAVAVALATGIVWEKHVLVPFAFLASRWFEGERVASLLRFATLLVAAALPQMLLRRVLGEGRPIGDVTTLDAQPWDTFARVHGLFLLMPLILLLVGWRRVPKPLRWLWCCVPVMFAIYVAQQRMLYEARSYWIFVPIFCGTIASVVMVDAPPDREPARSSPA